MENGNERLSSSASKPACQLELEWIVLVAILVWVFSRIVQIRAVSEPPRSSVSGPGELGARGEAVLGHQLSSLPPAWLARDVRIDGGVVEFALRLQDGKLLPVDSKWSGTRLAAEITTSGDPLVQKATLRKLERVVLDRAAEVRKYLQPPLTTDFAVAVVPDDVYGLVQGVVVRSYQRGVWIISTSLALPFLLLVMQLHRSGDGGGVSRAHLMAMEEEIESRFAKALKMLQNSRDQLRRGLAGLQLDRTSEDG